MSYNKYKNKWCICKNEHRHQSIKEANRCDELHLLEKAEHIKYLKIQVPFVLKINEILVCKHIVDFNYIENIKEVVEDVKGYETSLWRIKYKLFKALYPDIEYKIVK